MEAIDVKELARLGRKNEVPQLLARRAYAAAYIKADPVAQAIAYSDGVAHWRRTVIFWCAIFVLGIALLGLSFGTFDYLPPKALVTRLILSASVVALFATILGMVGVALNFLRPGLPPKDVAVVFAADLTLIRKWWDKPFWFWPLNHFGLKKVGEVILATQGAKIDRVMRELEQAVNEAAKVERMVRVGGEEDLFNRMHALLLKYEMAGPDKDYYREKGKELLAKQDRQASLLAEFHELNQVSLEEPTTSEAAAAEVSGAPVG